MWKEGKKTYTQENLIRGLVIFAFAFWATLVGAALIDEVNEQKEAAYEKGIFFGASYTWEEGKLPSRTVRDQVIEGQYSYQRWKTENNE